MTPRATHAQETLLQRFGGVRCVDIHCHCLPGVDDGPATPEEALALCRALADDGLTEVIATPHQLGRYAGRNTAAAVREKVAELQRLLLAHDVPLTVRPGADVRIDEQIPRLLDADVVLTLGDSKQHLLLELPHNVFVDPLPLIRTLAARGVRCVVSHPERHGHISRHPRVVLPWVQQGALLQVTAGSLLGDFGERAERCAWDLLAAGLVAIVATDAHDTVRRPPRFAAAAELIEQRFGPDAARRVCCDGPAGVLASRVRTGWGRRTQCLHETSRVPSGARPA